MQLRPQLCPLAWRRTRCAGCDSRAPLPPYPCSCCDAATSSPGHGHSWKSMLSLVYLYGFMPLVSLPYPQPHPSFAFPLFSQLEKCSPPEALSGAFQMSLVLGIPTNNYTEKISSHVPHN